MKYPNKYLVHTPMDDYNGYSLSAVRQVSDH